MCNLPGLCGYFGQVSAGKFTVNFGVKTASYLWNMTTSLFFFIYLFIWKKYTSGPRYWNVPVSVNTGTFLVYQYCRKM